MSQTALRPPLVVIGLSARMLAFSAARAGYRPIAIDLFADQDTREVAETIALTSFSEHEVVSVLRDLAKEYGKPPLVYGAGIDTRPDLLDRISAWTDRIGNSTAVVRAVHEPREFFGILDSLKIPYPEVRYEPPANPESWLFKLPFTEGGKGVRPASFALASPPGYYQRKLSGPAMSALFLANRGEARIVGFNTQWTIGPHAQSPYQFSGIMNAAQLSPEQKKRLAEYANKLVDCLALVGLNSLDFMVEEKRCKVLELNPRPGTSMILYDDLFPQGLLREHIDAGVRGGVPEAGAKPLGIRGLEVVYARRSLEIRPGSRWPDWAVDRPNPGARILLGEPICTIGASAYCEGSLRRLLDRRKQLIWEILSPSPQAN